MSLIPPEELEISSYDPRPPGGQHADVSTGVRVEHLPTGTVSIVMTNLSQHRNKAVAVRMIEAALTDSEFL